MATASSTAAPKENVSSVMDVTTVPSKKIILKRINVRIKSAAIATVFTLPRFVIPIRIHTMISAPITRHHTQCPTVKMPPAANAPS